MKRALVVYYSNGGAVADTLKKVIAPLETSPDVQVTWIRLSPVRAYPFPWSLYGLFDTSPETVGDVPVALEASGLRAGEQFDLVIIGWQVWWLRPSAPITAFLSGPGGVVIKDARVVLVGCARQMWLLAAARLRAAVAAAGGRCSDSIMVRYEGAGRTLVTTPLMLLTGRRAWSRFLPPAVLRSGEVEAAVRCGQRLLASTNKWTAGGCEPLLAGLAPASFDRAYLAPERVASFYMSLWRPVFTRFARRGQWSRPIIVVAWATGFAIGVLTVVPGWRLLYACFAWLHADRPPRVQSAPDNA